MNEDGLYQALGKSVATRRKALNKTQADIAAKLSLSRASLANIERGNQKVLMHQVYRIAEALELSDVRDLLPLTILNGSSVVLDADIPIHGVDNDLSEEQRSQIGYFVTKLGTSSKLGEK